MFKSKKIKIILVITATIIIALTAYVYSFDDIEPVCTKTSSREVYLLNYMSKDDLKQTVIDHNANISFTGTGFSRIYLMRDVFKIPDPVFNDEYDYSKGEGCNNFDIMDIYCVVDFTRLENGKIDAQYFFYE